MKILIESGVVNARREGLWTKYSINDETFNRAMDFLPELYKLKDKCVCQQIKYVKNPERQELGGADEFRQLMPNPMHQKAREQSRAF